MTDLIARIERCYDAIPREGGALVEEIGLFYLFIRQGDGWPYYARPRSDIGHFTPDNIRDVCTRQRELGVPQVIEWVHDLTPGLREIVHAAGLAVHEAPLMVLDPDQLVAPADVAVQFLDPAQPDFAALYSQSVAVAAIGFGASGTAAGPAGPAERDAALATPPPGLLERVAAGLRAARTAEAVAHTEADGIVARGAWQRGAGSAEIVGVATLPSARRRGYGAAISARLAEHALNHGADLIFLGADSDAVARIYSRVGFRRIGTACIAALDPAAPGGPDPDGAANARSAGEPG